ncbi:hypothetical protein WMW72_00995 [Paenibacillus filicis]|uniref:Inhibitor of sigma-G Gin n=1 Tax=Paenibacillus filicis TaxID=669464 RepID=A0ABU9DEN0_9BACL
MSHRKVIDCNSCGKVQGHGETGTEWICEDCRVSPAAEERSDPKDRNSRL